MPKTKKMIRILGFWTELNLENYPNAKTQEVLDDFWNRRFELMESGSFKEEVCENES